MLSAELEQGGKGRGEDIYKAFTREINLATTACASHNETHSTVPKNHRCMLQVLVKPDTQEHEGISESLTAILLPHNTFPHVNVRSYSSSGAV